MPEAIVTTVTLLEKGTLSRTPANLLGYQKPLSVNHFVIAAFLKGKVCLITLADYS